MKKKLEQRANVLRRKKYWLVNAILFYILKLNFYRNKKTWIFGCWEGNRYDDNSKYLFEYINEVHPEINAIWVTNKKDIADKVKSLGYQAVVSNTKEGRRAQLKAGVAFYTNGIDDFGNVCFVYGAKTVALWHGIGMKKTYYARMKDNRKMYIRQRIKDLIFSWVYRDITISTSRMASEQYRETFLIDNNTIVLTGFPRNDVFKQKVMPSMVLKNIASADLYRYILYMPTYRPYDEFIISDTIRTFSETPFFLAYLKENKIRVLLKLHYLSKIDSLVLPPEIIVIDNEQISSTQELLAISDMLITDYSSCITDYALTGRPSLLYTPDFDRYYKNVGLISECMGFYDYAINDINLVMKTIIETFEGKNDISLRTTKYISGLCEDISIKNSCYCENVYNCI